MKDRKVVNYWAPFQDLYKCLKDSTKYVFDKKNKRFPDYQATLREMNKPVIMVLIPNTTRVAGALIIMQDSIR